MNMNEAIKELMDNGFSFEESCKIHKSIVKKRIGVLNLYEEELAERIGVKKAHELFIRLTASTEIGINPLHSMVYGMGRPLNIDKVDEIKQND